MAKNPRRPENRIVHIVVHGDEITVSPTVLKAAADSVVEWRAPGAESFVLVFRDGAAVAERGFGKGVEVTSQNMKMEVEPWVSPLLKEAVGDSMPFARARLSDGLGVHPYQLAVLKNGRIYLDAGCPEVIIQ